MRRKIGDSVEAILDTAERLREEVRRNIAISVGAGFAFLIALVWKDVIQEGVNIILEYLQLTGEGYHIKLLSAVVVTVICIVGIIYISRWAPKKEEK